MSKPSTVVARRPRLGELLVAQGLIDAAQLGQALRLAKERGTRLGTQLLMAGWIQEADLARFLSEQLGLPSLSRLSEVDPSAPAQLPAAVAVRHAMIAVRRTADGLYVALADPSDEAALVAAHRATGLPILPMVAPELVVAYGVRRFYAPEPEPSPPPRGSGPQFVRDDLGLEVLQ